MGLYLDLSDSGGPNLARMVHWTCGTVMLQCGSTISLFNGATVEYIIILCQSRSVSLSVQVMSRFGLFELNHNHKP